MQRLSLLKPALGLGLGLLLLLFAWTVQALEEPRFRPIKPMFIAALGDADAVAGTGAEQWGLWKTDPGPRGVWLRYFPLLQAVGGRAPTGWKLDIDKWWLDENGLLMEEPDFPLPAGQYLVTGEREAITMLTVHAKDAKGVQRWELARDIALGEVTHLPCRSALYTPVVAGADCSPANAPRSAFKVAPGAEMPAITGCAKQDYRVLIVVGLPEA